MDVGCVFVYIDDILVFSESEEQHHSDLEKVLSFLEENNFKFSIDKCQFYKSNIKFLGYSASAEGLKPTAQKNKDIKNIPEPTNSKSLRWFLGMVDFYRKLIPQAEDVLLLLTEVIKRNLAAKTLKLGPPKKEAFIKIKDILVEVSAVTHPDPNTKQYHQVTDSSNYAVGAALLLIINGESIPIGFYSRKLSECQKKYSCFNWELFAGYQAVLHFKPEIEGRNVTLFSDHKPLSQAFKNKTPMKSDIQQRYLSIITEYVVDVSYIRGEDNIVAAYLDQCASDHRSLRFTSNKRITENEWGTWKIQKSVENVWNTRVIYLVWLFNIHSQTLHTRTTTQKDLWHVPQHLTSRTHTNNQDNKIEIFSSRHGREYTNLGKRQVHR